MAPKLLDLVVDEKGNLYKCLESVGRDDESFGSVGDFDFANPQSGNMGVLSEWLDYAWPDDEECMQCPLLPACLGGCPQRRREGKKECTPIKQMTDEYVVALAYISRTPLGSNLLQDFVRSPPCAVIGRNRTR